MEEKRDDALRAALARRARRSVEGSVGPDALEPGLTEHLFFASLYRVSLFITCPVENVERATAF